VRGRGLLLALNLQSEIGPQVVGLALQRGLLINAPRTDTLRYPLDFVNVGCDARSLATLTRIRPTQDFGW